MSSARITIQDLRDAGYCTAGIRDAFKEKGLDFRNFVRNGATVAQARAAGFGAIVDRSAEVQVSKKAI